MWRNKGGRFRGRGGFVGKKSSQFARNNLPQRGIRKRNDARDSIRTDFDDKSQSNRDFNRGLREQSRNFDVDENRYERPGLENRGDNYLDARDQYRDHHSETFNVRDEFHDSVDYREQDDRRNVVEDSRGYGGYNDRDNDHQYWEDRKPQRLDDDRRIRDQEFRSDDYYGSKETFEFTIDTSDRYDGDLRNSLTDFRAGEPHHQKHGQQSEGYNTFRENRTGQQHHAVSNRSQSDQRPNFDRGEHTSHSGKDERNNRSWNRERVIETKSNYKTNQQKKSYGDNRKNSRSTDRSGSERQQEFARSSSSDRRGKGSKNSETSKSNSSGAKKSASETQRKGRSETSSRSEATSRYDKKKSEVKVAKQSENASMHTINSHKTSSKDKNTKRTDKNSSESSKKDQSKPSLMKKNSSSLSKKREDRKQSNSSSIADSSSFKKPGEKHSSRPRSNSGRKLDSDIGHFDDADILSIMADDDGFEREMKMFSHSNERSRSRQRKSRERGSQERISKSMEKADKRQWHSRERASIERCQHRKDSGSNEQHQHRRENTDKFDTRPTYDKHSKQGTSKVGSGQSYERNVDFISQGRIQSNSRSGVSASTNRFGTYLKHDQRHTGDRNGFRLTGRINNNNLVGRSRFSTAAKIKDSYFKRKKTFQGISNQRFDNRHMSKSLVENKNSDLSKVNTYGKNEVGITGAILKEDRMIEKRGFSNARNKDSVRQGYDDKRKNKFDRGFKTFSNAHVRGSRFQREGAKFGNKDKFTGKPFKARDVASQRVKQKYFRGGFSQNRNQRNSRGGYKDYDRRKGRENEQWDRGFELDNEKLPDVIQDDGHNNDLSLEDQAVELNPQQVIFIPNNELQSSQPHMGQPHMVDQFGQIILNPEVGVQQGEESVPVQYLSQQFHNPDGVPQGEQVVFIPFVNNQGPQDYSGNLPTTYNENIELPDVGKAIPEKIKGKKASRGKNVALGKKKPLSQQARAKLRKSLEIKRKQRMEKEIEQKLLKKLLSNPEVSKAVRESNEVKKKPVIKRISPPSASHQSNKQYKLVRRGNVSQELDDVSEDEDKYDNVSDLEDVSDFEEGDEEYESRQGKRPVFRKPGQPRINKNFTNTSKDIKVTSGDVRRVVDNSSKQQSSRAAIQSSDRSPRMDKADSVQSFNQGNKGRRSVYIENPKSNTEKVIGQKRTSHSSSYETHQIKKRRSISPIEITVSNDKFSETTYRSSSQENEDHIQYESSNRKSERKSNYRPNYSADGTSEDRFERFRNERNEGYEKGKKETFKDERNRKNEKDRERSNFRMSEKGSREDNKYRYDHNISKVDSDERKRGIDQRDKGKYFDDKGIRRGEGTFDSRNQKKDDYKERAHDKFDDTYSDNNYRRGDNSWQGRNDRLESRKEKSRDSNKNNRNDSFRGDRSLSDDRSSGRSSQRHDRDRTDNSDHGTSRNIQDGNYVSSVNQSQFQMNQPMVHQSVHSQPFIAGQSPSIPIHGQSVMQFSTSSSSVDHSLPPVQNSPISMPPFPPSVMGVRPDMSLPPPVMNVVGTPTSMGTMVIQQHQQPNSVQQFQQQHQMPQQMNMQQQVVQQQQYQNVQPQYQQQQQQQQFQQMQTQPQMIQQQTNPTFQTNQPAYQSNIQSNQQMPLQQMQTGQYQQTQTGVNMIPVNQNQPTGSINQGQRGSSQQGISTSGTFSHYVASSQQQPVRSQQPTIRGVIGTIKQPVDSSNIRRGQPVRASAIKTQVSNVQTMSRRQGTGNQSNFSPRRGYESYGHVEDDNDANDDEYLEMLCSKCDKVFLSREVMRRHGRWHDKVESNTKSGRCDQCEQAFTSSLAHTDHMSTKHSVDSWNCSLCDKTFSLSVGLNRHVRHASHKDMKVKFVCSLCPASFMVLTQLIQHKKEIHHYNSGYSGLRKY